MFVFYLQFMAFGDKMCKGELEPIHQQFYITCHPHV